jgi:hypothetical protein
MAIVAGLNGSYDAFATRNYHPRDNPVITAADRPLGNEVLTSRRGRLCPMQISDALRLTGFRASWFAAIELRAFA